MNTTQEHALRIVARKSSEGRPLWSYHASYEPTFKELAADGHVRFVGYLGERCEACGWWTTEAADALGELVGRLVCQETRDWERAHPGHQPRHEESILACLDLLVALAA